MFVYGNRSKGDLNIVRRQGRCPNAKSRSRNIARDHTIYVCASDRSDRITMLARRTRFHQKGKTRCTRNHIITPTLVAGLAFSTYPYYPVYLGDRVRDLWEKVFSNFTGIPACAAHGFTIKPWWCAVSATLTKFRVLRS